MNRWLAILLLPLAMGASAAVLFLLQGGFGAGHKPFDFGLWVLGQPTIWMVEFFPVWPGDFVAIVLAPAAMNCALWYVLLVLGRRLLGTRRT